MTALDADRRYDSKWTGRSISMPVAASTTLYAGAVVAVNSGGYAVPADDVAALRCVGVCQKQVDNSAGSNGTLSTTVLTGTFKVKNAGSGAAVTQADVGRPVYVLDDQTAQDGDAGSPVVMGICDRLDTDGVWVYIAPEFSAESLVSGVDALTDSGAISPFTRLTNLSVTGTDAYTLADGLYVTQRKTIRCIAVGANPVGVVTPATVSASTAGGTTPATFTVNAAGQEVELEWLADGWKIIGSKAAAVAAVTDASTVNLLSGLNQATIAGTDTITIPDGWYPGQLCTVAAIAASATPIMVLSGKFYDEDGSADGITVTHNPCAVGDISVLSWVGARWAVINHINAAVAP